MEPEQWLQRDPERMHLVTVHACKIMSRQNYAYLSLLSLWLASRARNLLSLTSLPHLAEVHACQEMSRHACQGMGREDVMRAKG